MESKLLLPHYFYTWPDTSLATNWFPQSSSYIRRILNKYRLWYGVGLMVRDNCSEYTDPPCKYHFHSQITFIRYVVQRRHKNAGMWVKKIQSIWGKKCKWIIEKVQFSLWQFEIYKKCIKCAITEHIKYILKPKNLNKELWLLTIDSICERKKNIGNRGMMAIMIILIIYAGRQHTHQKRTTLGQWDN